MTLYDVQDPTAASKPSIKPTNNLIIKPTVKFQVALTLASGDFKGVKKRPQDILKIT